MRIIRLLTTVVGISSNVYRLSYNLLLLYLMYLYVKKAVYRDNQPFARHHENPRFPRPP